MLNDIKAISTLVISRDQTYSVHVTYVTWDTAQICGHKEQETQFFFCQMGLNSGLGAQTSNSWISLTQVWCGRNENISPTLEVNCLSQDLTHSTNPSDILMSYSCILVNMGIWQCFHTSTTSGWKEV